MCVAHHDICGLTLPCLRLRRVPTRSLACRSAPLLRSARINKPRVVPSRANSVLRDALSDLSETQAAVRDTNLHMAIISKDNCVRTAEGIGVQVLSGGDCTTRCRGGSKESIPHGTNYL